MIIMARGSLLNSEQASPVERKAAEEEEEEKAEAAPQHRLRCAEQHERNKCSERVPRREREQEPTRNLFRLTGCGERHRNRTGPTGDQSLHCSCRRRRRHRFPSFLPSFLPQILIPATTDDVASRLACRSPRSPVGRRLSGRPSEWMMPSMQPGR